MLNLGPLAFAQPWILLALIGLPVLWWLLRVTPPSPKRIRFPALRFLLGLSSAEETPARTPLWLILLRMTIAALLILALAEPLLNPSAALQGRGPLILVVDDGWAAARNWEARRNTAEALLTQAERDSRPVLILPTAPAAGGELPEPSDLVTASEAKGLMKGLEPKPWPSDRAAVLAALESLNLEGPAHAVWLSDGLDDESVQPLMSRLRNLGSLDLYLDQPGNLPHLLLQPESEGTGLRVSLQRLDAGADAAAPETVFVRALGDDGRLLARSEVAFEEGGNEAQALITLPAELRNRIGRLTIEGEDQAAGVLLLDERWRRRPVGLVSGGGEVAQPLLSDLYYLRRALEPFTVLQEGDIDSLIERKLAVMVLADVGALPEAEVERLGRWVEAGGLLLRFAGPRLAESDAADSLLPVRLRGGGRILGGVLTWDTPSRLAPFDAKSPFAGLATPKDVTVRRQVLAEPTLDLGERTWARLNDGTPLVTAEHRGEGWLVLVHTTANTEWSDLALSGLYVDMLRRLVALSQGVAGEGEAGGELPPVETLDGFGRLGAPTPNVLAIDGATLAADKVGPSHPPGYYGSQGQRSALNLAPGLVAPNRGPLATLGPLPRGVGRFLYAGSAERSTKAWLLTAALLLALIDLLIALGLRGLIRPGGPRKAAKGGAALGMLLLLLFPAPPAAAQSPGQSPAEDAFALAATLETRLAFVQTGVPAVDAVSEEGLTGLTRILERRTSVEPGPPLGVTLGRDEISFFPLLYWPITPEQRDLTEAARSQVKHFLTHGGTIFFDLREVSTSAQVMGTATRNQQALSRLTQGLDIPPLAPVPPEHVLTKSFYLMQDFPGRYDGGTLWIGATEGHVNDGISSILVGSNDWAGAWAIDERGRSRFAVVPGGELQREMAFRVGVNLVMYALTGNYKADQVHVPFILERLGQ